MLPGGKKVKIYVYLTFHTGMQTRNPFLRKMHISSIKYYSPYRPQTCSSLMNVKFFSRVNRNTYFGAEYSINFKMLLSRCLSTKPNSQIMMSYLQKTAPNMSGHHFMQYALDLLGSYHDNFFLTSRL